MDTRKNIVKMTIKTEEGGVKKVEISTDDYWYDVMKHLKDTYEIDLRGCALWNIHDGLEFNAETGGNHPIGKYFKIKHKKPLNLSFGSLHITNEEQPVLNLEVVRLKSKNLVQMEQYIEPTIPTNLLDKIQDEIAKYRRSYRDTNITEEQRTAIGNTVLHFIFLNCGKLPLPEEDIKRVMDFFSGEFEGYTTSTGILKRNPNDTLKQKIEEAFNLIREINNQIVKIKKHGEYQNHLWKDATSRYPDKLAILRAINKYLTGLMTKNDLDQKIKNHPQYNKGGGLGKAETEKLLDRALKLKPKDDENVNKDEKVLSPGNKQ